MSIFVLKLFPCHLNFRLLKDHIRRKLLHASPQLSDCTYLFDRSVHTWDTSNSKSHEKKKKMFDLVWPIPEDRYDDVIVHLRENFFPDEPLNKSVGLCQKPGQPHRELEEHAISTLTDSISVMALDGKEIVGVILNGVLREGDLEQAVKKLECSEDDKFKTIFGQLYRINIELDLFKRFEVDKIFEARILSVDKNYRGQGLAAKLTAKCDEVAIATGFKLIKEDSTGIFSQKLFEKQGHQTICEIKYEDLKDEEGEVIFKTPPPHESLKIMVKWVGE